MFFLRDFCRLCLCSDGELNNMCNDDTMEKVVACIKDLEFEEHLPAKICKSCLNQIDNYYTFRNQCIRSEYMLNLYMEKLIKNTSSHFISSKLMVNVFRNFYAPNSLSRKRKLGIKTKINSNSTMQDHSENVNKELKALQCTNEYYMQLDTYGDLMDHVKLRKRNAQLKLCNEQNQKDPPQAEKNKHNCNPGKLNKNKVIQSQQAKQNDSNYRSDDYVPSSLRDYSLSPLSMSVLSEESSIEQTRNLTDSFSVEMESNEEENLIFRKEDAAHVLTHSAQVEEDLEDSFSIKDESEEEEASLTIYKEDDTHNNDDDRNHIKGNIDSLSVKDEFEEENLSLEENNADVTVCDDEDIKLGGKVEQIEDNLPNSFSVMKEESVQYAILQEENTDAVKCDDDSIKLGTNQVEENLVSQEEDNTDVFMCYNDDDCTVKPCRKNTQNGIINSFSICESQAAEVSDEDSVTFHEEEGVHMTCDNDDNIAVGVKQMHGSNLLVCKSSLTKGYEENFTSHKEDNNDVIACDDDDDDDDDSITDCIKRLKENLTNTYSAYKSQLQPGLKNNVVLSDDGDEEIDVVTCDDDSEAACIQKMQQSLKNTYSSYILPIPKGLESKNDKIDVAEIVSKKYINSKNHINNNRVVQRNKHIQKVKGRIARRKFANYCETLRLSIPLSVVPNRDKLPCIGLLKCALQYIEIMKLELELVENKRNSLLAEQKRLLKVLNEKRVNS